MPDDTAFWLCGGHYRFFCWILDGIVFLYNAEGKIEVECTSLESQQDIKWHQYLVDISDQSGECIMIFHGGGTNNTCDIASQYLFSDVGLY